MNGEYILYCLSDVIQIIGGGTPKREVAEYWGGDIPWLSVVDFNDNQRFVSSSLENITQKGLENSSTKLLQAGQIIISARGTVGCIAQLDKPMAFNQSCYGLNAKESVLINDYLYYLLKQKVVELKRIAHGAVFETITRSTFDNIQVLLPSIDVQIKVAEILGCFDKKIQLNHQINQTLESIAQAIFKSWFVDFDPVKAKIEVLENGGSEEEALLAAMRVISSKSEEELAEFKVDQPEEYAQLRETAELFPSAMAESELGEIPEGWEASVLGEHFNIVMGQSPKGDTYNENGQGMLFFQGRKDFGFRYPKPRVYTTDPKRLAQAGDTLISVRAPVGDRNMAAEECCLGRGVAGLRHKSGSRSFTYAFIGHIEKSLGDSGSEGTVFSSINKRELERIDFIAPNEELVVLFEQFIYPIDQKIELLTNEAESIETLRDTLLPKLLSGELDVSGMIEAKEIRV